MARMNPLAKVTDGEDASALMRAGAFNFFLAAPWIALWFGVHVTGGGWFAVFLAGTLMAGGIYLFSRIPEREETPSPGVWLTTRKGRWRRQAVARAPLLGMLVMLIMAVVAAVRGRSPPGKPSMRFAWRRRSAFRLSWPR
ncbi:hypothetical protein [Caulobacter sp. UNC279MFTsu5.1]|uniref:hypothetical protein n=1 Tax=Caulobacter sp. UNC279MFTsu5.1 TaxID=1502775 RepID=UPI0003A5D157|nr:hypothetical protein [Caulobacter sp. UNC279MFTsu5.1]